MLRLFKPKTSYLDSASTIPYSGMTLCDALDRAAENSPDKEAFVFVSKLGRESITYKQLHHDVIKFAAGLLHFGLKPGDRVGIWFENRYEWILTQYASAYIKLVTVRFLVGYKAEYMKYLFNKTKVSTLFIGSGNPENVFREMVAKGEENNAGYENFSTLQRIIHIGQDEKAGMFRFTFISELGIEVDFQQLMEIRKTVQPDDEVMIIFTSGSTGMPKAVVRSHRCVAENLYTSSRHIADVVSKAGKDVRCMCTSPFAHIGGDTGTIMGVISRFTVIIPDPEADTSMIAEVIQKESITVTILMFHYLFDFINQPQFRDHDFSSLECLLTGGNLVPKEALDRVRQLVTPNLFTGLGSTEAGYVTFNFNQDKFSKIGYPIDHQEIKVVDDKGNIVPLNTTGELCVRSPYIFLRYEGDEEETNDIDVSGWFHTGDLCLMEEDGCLHVMGRKKDIIIKGERNIYPQEIERILVRHPKVKLPQVVSVPDQRLVEEICACICLENDQEATVDEILEFVRPILEEYFVPKYVLFFESFPSSLSGKIARIELAKKASERLGLNK
ncbi:medium-chain acyl-CoA ligase ACSF2, mitochondrial-like [Glandiceps talaboti]